MPTVEEKREAAIAKKDAERKAKNEEIAKQKKESADARAKEKSEKEQEQAAADAKKAEMQKKREENISKKEGERSDKAAAKKAGGKSKYSKKDVFELKQVFDEYDQDKGGTISLQEFTGSLKKKKQANAPRAGEKSTREQRQQSEGVSIFEMVRGHSTHALPFAAARGPRFRRRSRSWRDLTPAASTRARASQSEGVFHEMDINGDGNVLPLARATAPAAPQSQLAHRPSPRFMAPRHACLARPGVV